MRVLGHEIGNSLGPIQSVAGVLRQGLASEPSPRWTEDARSGLALIERRAEALARFTTAYARLARLPPPKLAPVEVEPWVRRAAALAEVQVVGGPPLHALGDADQLDQLLINLCRNAAEAAAETGGDARIHWSRAPGRVRVVVEDDGPGLPPAWW